MNSNDYGYGGQKRPLEDGGTHTFLLRLFLWSVATVPERLQVVFLFVDSWVFFHSTALKRFVPFIVHYVLFHLQFCGKVCFKPLCSNRK